MTNKKFIIEYIGGCKGDLLTWNLNKISDYNNSQKFNKTVDFFNKISFGNHEHQFKPDIIKFKNNIVNNTKRFKFSNSHQLHYVYMKSYYDLLVKNNIEIKKIVFCKKYYKTIRIEGFVKKFDIVDYFLKKFDTPLTDANRAEFFYDLCLSDNKYYADYEIYNLHYKTNLNKKLIDYETLYINFNCDEADIIANLNFNDFKTAVANSWLPDKIELYGEEWDLRKYGYREF